MKKKHITRATKRRLRVFGILSLFCIFYFIFSLIYELYQVYELKCEQDKLQIEYKALVNESKKLKVQIDELNDPEYLAKYARENYSYSKEGEYIIKLKDNDKKRQEVDKKVSNQYLIIVLTTISFIIFIIIVKKNKNRS